MYRERLCELKKMGLLGVLLGVVLGILICVNTGGINVLCLIASAIYFAGTPYGWGVFGKVFNFIIIGPVPCMIIGFALRIICAVVLGWFLYPIALIYNLIKSRREGK